MFPQIPSKPLDIVHVDIYSINNKQVLTVIDKFSKFAAAYTLDARNSLLIVKSLKHFMSLHGIPKKLVTDSGTEFTATLFKDFCKQYNIILHHTSIQQSSSNSPVERLHSTLTEIYRIIYDKLKNRDHDEILSETLLTYNNAIHSSIKLTPFEVFYGRTHKFEKQEFNNVHDYLSKLNEFQRELFPSIKAYVETMTRRNIEKLNESRNDPTEYNVDTDIYRKENRRNKLTPRFSRHRVKVNKNITLLTNKNKKFHKSKIKKKLKFQANTTDPGAGDGNSRPHQQQGVVAHETGNS